MMKLMRSKRGLDAFTLVLTILAICVLLIILVGLTVKYNKLANTIGGAGSSASSILSAYDKADSALLYLDNAVGISMQDSIYELAHNGFYYGAGSCGVSSGRALWSDGTAQPVEGAGMCEAVTGSCTPGSYNSFKNYFADKLKQQLIAYNSDSDVRLPEDGYELLLVRPGDAAAMGELCAEEGEGCFGGRTEGQLQLVGIAAQPLVVNSTRIRYEVMPSFRENSDVDLIGDFGKITGRAGQLVGKDESSMGKMVASYAGETGLEWNVDSYNRACGQACNTGEKCTYCCEEEVVEVSCATEEKPDCKKMETVCVRTCEGNLNHYYCDITADIGVKIPDGRYDKGGAGGYKSFVTNAGGVPEVKEYNYMFSLNWVEMQESKQCI